MAIRSSLSNEEFARLGNAIFARDVQPTLTAEDEGKTVAIDVASGDFEANEDELEACKQLEARRPNAEIWFVRVGSRSFYRFGLGMQDTK